MKLMRIFACSDIKLKKETIETLKKIKSELVSIQEKMIVDDSEIVGRESVRKNIYKPKSN